MTELIDEHAWESFWGAYMEEEARNRACSMCPKEAVCVGSNAQQRKKRHINFLCHETKRSFTLI